MPNNPLEPTLTAAENGDWSSLWIGCRVREGEPGASGRFRRTPHLGAAERALSLSKGERSTSQMRAQPALGIGELALGSSEPALGCVECVLEAVRPPALGHV